MPWNDFVLNSLRLAHTADSESTKCVIFMSEFLLTKSVIEWSLLI